MTNFTPDDYIHMTLALRLAEQGLHTSMPNPRVGCVIVKDGVVVGKGAHIKAGTQHAEVHALKQAGMKAEGATVYVTLEPCSHHGRTPPCAEMLVKAKVERVIIAMQDPNPLVAGQGAAAIESAGITVLTGLMQQQAEGMNAGFISRMVKQRPLVRSKIAASLDGKTALSNGESKWITGAAARSDVQNWRARSCAMMTGIGTVLTDNPSLTVREYEIDRQPLSVVVDSELRIPFDAKILQNPDVLVAFATDEGNRAEQLQSKGTSLLCIPNTQGKVCLESLLSHLASNEINEVMVEGGGGLNGALMTLNCIDEFLIYYAPKLMGSNGKGMFAIAPLTSMQAVVNLDVMEIRQFGNDIRVLAKRAP